MCFSNLPIEFNEEGDPYLAEDAAEVDDVSASGCGCGTHAEDVPLEAADPEEMYAEIMATMPRSVRERLADGAEEQGDAVEGPGGAGHRDSAEGD